MWLHDLIHALMVTLFVFVMMLLVDYTNVATRGRLSAILRGNRLQQYTVASLLGSLPGCLGSFLNVSFYVHGLISFGAIVGGMIATSGDEAYVMLAMFPHKALLLFALLFVLGIALAWVTDLLAPLLGIRPCEECRLQVVHQAENYADISKQELLQNFLSISVYRAVLLGATVLFLVAIAAGMIGPPTWDWKRITLIALLSLTAIIIGSASEHYLREHIWRHLVKKHLWRVFLWTFGALFLVDMLLNVWNLNAFIQHHLMAVMLIAVLIGIIPESGPHLVFVMLYAKGAIPFSVLVASSIVQDGHGMLPLFSYTVKDSLLIKGFNVVYGLLIGWLLQLAGV
ncbi:MAG TPA: selenocysteine protein [Bacteroidetes bacterium]|nr:selenocysteine protein [Bacteroidota bacterium]